MELKPEPIYPTGFGGGFGLIAHYLNAGYFEKALKLEEDLIQNEPLHQGNRGGYMHILSLLGDTQRAEEEYEYGNMLFGDDWIRGNREITWIRLGAKDIVSRDDIVASDPISYVAKEYLESPEKGLMELRRLYTDNENLSCLDLTFMAMWAAYFGNPEFALEVKEKAASINGTPLNHIWHPLMLDVRQLPRFKEFVREIGLVEYWNKFGWPDICRQLDKGDFECD